MALARWQWEDYHLGHASRKNLAIHLVAVPFFVLGNVLLVGGIWYPLWLGAADPGLLADLWTIWLIPLLGLLLSAAAMAWQGAGHKGEEVAPKPFTGVGNVFGRIFLEQWFTFWRFLFSGGWWRAWKAAA